VTDESLKILRTHKETGFGKEEKEKKRKRNTKKEKEAGKDKQIGEG